MNKGLKSLVWQQTCFTLVKDELAGTSLMLAAPSSAIDLPLKTLVWEDVHIKVWIS
jgi:hypothetical protein